MQEPRGLLQSASSGAEAHGKNTAIYTISFASVYPHYVAKAEKKGRTKAEVDEIIRWLTGYSQKALEAAAGEADRLRDLLREGARAQSRRAR